MSKHAYYPDTLTEEEKFWLNKLSGDINMSSFTQDHKKTTNIEEESHLFTYQLSDDLSHEMIRLANESEYGLLIILTAGVKYLLSIYSGSRDVSIGTPVIRSKSGRAYQDHHLIIRSDIHSCMSCKDLLLEVQKNISEANKNQNVSYDHLAKLLGLEPRKANRLKPRTIIQLDNIQHDLKVHRSNADTTFRFHWDGRNIVCTITSQSNERERIEKMTDMLTVFFEALVKKPSTRLSDIDFLSTDRDRILYEFNSTSTEYPKDKSVVELFEMQVSKTPHETAVIFQDQKLTYQELNKKANHLANELVKQGITENKIVGIMLDRSLELPIALLGVLKAGGAYLPISHDYPEERINYLISNSGVDILLTNNVNQEFHKQNIRSININTILSKDTYAEMEDNLELTISPESLMYVLYTSGSTGEPKGVMVKRNSFVNLLSWYTNEFGMSQTDNVLLIAPISFDTAHKNVFAPIIIGAKLHLFQPGIYDYNEMSNYIHLHNITTINCTPSGFYPLVDYNERSDFSRLASLKHVFLGGESVHCKRLMPLAESDNFKSEIVNTYGPTECTDIAAFYRISNLEIKQMITIPIGKPIDNAEIYIVDQNMNLLPIGIPGELCIAGAGMSHGYANAPELTDAKFVDFQSVPGKKVYKTGDMARWLPDGNVEFLGRKDNLTKIRGFRVETGEIEICLMKHLDVEEAAVIAMEDPQGTKELSAYFTSEVTITISELRNFLMKRLPEYMVPVYFTQLKTMPHNQNGKIDRHALPKPYMDQAAGEGFVAPLGDVEEKITRIWEDVLTSERIGVYDNFFELGGHSLKAASIILKINQEFETNLKLNELFKKPTIKEITALISDKSQNKDSNILPVAEKECYPVSSQQKRLYILWQLSRDSVAYNLPAATMIEGQLNLDKLIETFQTLVDRHEALRTSFSFVDGQLMQFVHPRVDVSVEIVDAKEEEAMETVKSLIKPFHLEKPPLFHIYVIRLEKNKHLLVTDAHHIVFDGISMDIIMEEFTEYYSGKDLPQVNLQYRDYAVWQERFFQIGEFTQKEKYWLNLFKEGVPVLQLNTDYPRLPMQDEKGDYVFITAEDNLTYRLRKIAAENGSTLYMVLLSALNVLFFKYTGQEDIVIGSPSAGRSRAGLEKVIGMFVNTVVMRNFPSREKTFRTLLNEVKDAVLKALDHEEYPFEVLVEQLNVHRDPGRNPVFDIMFALDMNENTFTNAGDLSFRNIAIESSMTQFDLFIHAVETENSIDFKFKYRSNLFAKTTIQRMADHFIRLLNELTKTIDWPLKKIQMISEEEKHTLLSEFNKTEKEYSFQMTIQELFEGQAKDAPSATALHWKDNALTYFELEMKANQLARVLRKKGVQRNTIVGIMSEPSLNMVIGLLGIIKAGGAFLPIDPGFPISRINYLLEDSGCQVILAQHSMDKTLSLKQQVVLLDEETFCGEEGERLENINQPEDLAYVMYTSGTTGNPKGVMIEHRNLVNQILGLASDLQIEKEDCHLLLAKMTFDVSVQQIFLPTLSGGTLYIPDKALAAEPGKLWTFIENHKIDILGAVPAHLNVLISSPPSNHQLRYILVAGEVFTKKLYDELRRIVHADNILNLYGPTEATIFSTLYTCSETEKGSSLPIGKPLSNYRAYILDRDHQPVPIGATGELCIGGAGVARGYINKPDLTNERFVSDSIFPDQKMYKTGDLARWLPDGNIEYIGRIDHQVKINGVRIEPDEINDHLINHDAIENSVVVAKQHPNRESYLCAYVIAKQEMTAAELRAYLKNKLPEYMIPASFVQLKQLPLTANDKIDRKALQNRKDEDHLQSKTVYTAPSSHLEKRIADIWKQILGMNQVGIHDHFFELGGNSLTIIQVNERLKEELEIDISVVELFRHPTISSLAQQVKSKNENRTPENENADRGKVMEESRNRLKQRRQRKRDWNGS
ncbi:amino acid adenylation domain-containing protein [Bacillus gobiensis]|uniref:amino acid adenylation domain-containing protein n=1 Tax=Bacillus gobiensis TaxID=1441095 RepID=UPI003D1CF1A6